MDTTTNKARRDDLFQVTYLDRRNQTRHHLAVRTCLTGVVMNLHRQQARVTDVTLLDW